MTLPIRSPWLHQLNRTRTAVPLDADITTDIAVVGGGIAGIATAYFLLHRTDKNVVLLEAAQVAHGATGHNAGQLVADFERPFTSLVREFGLDMTVRGYRDITSAWLLLDEIQHEMKLTSPVWRITGYTGLTDQVQITEYLESASLRRQASMPTPPIMLAQEWQSKLTISGDYAGLYEWAPQKQILDLLETHDPAYIALVADERGCHNSALFCEELAQALLARWPERFAIYERTPVERAQLRRSDALLHTPAHTITCQNVVLCTNGFEKITLANENGPDIDGAFHHDLRGKIAYMGAFTEPSDHPPMANEFRSAPGIDPETDYFYITRRPYDLAAVTGAYNLLSIGGPTEFLDERATYTNDRPYGAAINEAIDTFMLKTYKPYEPGRTEEAFFWHGLMGYTKNGVRLIGPEPRNPILLYNLGCNGIGLLHSIFGGSKIAALIRGTPMEPSMFDPKG